MARFGFGNEYGDILDVGDDSSGYGVVEVDDQGVRIQGQRKTRTTRVRKFNFNDVEVRGIIKGAIHQKVLFSLSNKSKKTAVQRDLERAVDAVGVKVNKIANSYLAKTIRDIDAFLAKGHPVGAEGMKYEYNFSKPKIIPFRQEVSPVVVTGIRNHVIREPGLVLEAGRATAIAGWRQLPQTYMATYSKQSSKHAPGILTDPRGRWAALKKFRSGRFWKKTGEGYEAFHQWANANMPGYVRGYSGEEKNKIRFSQSLISNTDRFSKSGNSKVVFSESKTKTRLGRATLILTPNDFGHPFLDAVIRKSFVTTRPVEYRQGLSWQDGVTKTIEVEGKNGKKKKTKVLVAQDVDTTRGVNRLAYAEHTRPFMARFAAEMGRRQRKQIAKFLNPR